MVDMAVDKQDIKRVNASPTKEFFIYMITRDITLTRAILDLVDNSVDGARRMRPNRNFDGLWVRVEIDRKHFRIADNCGGISVDIARNYAFRFGRPKEAPPTPGSVGQFGVGMKRTFFKLGRHFTVSSTEINSRFEMDIDVDRWKADDRPGGAGDWQFEFAEVEENLTGVKDEDIGTRIEITQLYDSVAENFGLESFLTRLKQEMSLAHTLSLDAGLAITINKIPLLHDPAKLFVSENLKPAFIEKSYPSKVLVGEPGPPVNVKLYAGVAERNLRDGGWYVFCNGRLVIRADQSATTVWGSSHGMRQYHPDFAYFRGYAYFDSDDPSLLPWTTTKTGVDVDSPVYRSVQQEMIELSKPVLTFLSDLVKERTALEKGRSKEQPLNLALQNSEAQRTEEMAISQTFIAPKPAPPPSGPKMNRIQYWKPADEVQKAMQILKVKTFVAVGEKTFEYFMRYEAEE